MPENIQTDQIKRAENKCPWCVENKKDSKLIQEPGVRWQCQTCGKHWDDDALGKKYSIVLERGKAWAAEMKRIGMSID